MQSVTNQLKLIEVAVQAKHKALALYSNFRVGAALRTRSGRVYDGCNIESSSYSLTCCAERVALFKALSEGEREFAEIAVAADTTEFCTPCGACRQLLWDFARDIKIILINQAGDTRTMDMPELLPDAFDDRLL